MVYLVIAVIFLHMISLPLTTRISAKADTNRNTARLTVKFLLIPVFAKTVSFETIKKRIFGEEFKNEPTERDDDKEKDDKNSSRLKKFMLEFLLRAAKRVRVRDADLAAVIGTGDAAADAVAVGTLRILYKQACAYSGIDSDGDIRPDYNTETLFFDFFGIFSICFADIIVALCGTLFSRLRIGGRKNYANVTE